MGRKCGVLELIKFARPSGHQEKAVNEEFIKEGERLV